MLNSQSCKRAGRRVGCVVERRAYLVELTLIRRIAQTSAFRKCTETETTSWDMCGTAGCTFPRSTGSSLTFTHALSSAFAVARTTVGRNTSRTLRQGKANESRMECVRRLLPGWGCATALGAGTLLRSTQGQQDSTSGHESDTSRAQWWTRLFGRGVRQWTFWKGCARRRFAVQRAVGRAAGKGATSCLEGGISAVLGPSRNRNTERATNSNLPAIERNCNVLWNIGKERWKDQWYDANR